MSPTATSTPPSRPPRPRPASSGGPSGAGSLAVSGLDPMRILRVYWMWLTLAGVIGISVGIGLYFLLATIAPKFSASTTFEVLPPSTAGLEITELNNAGIKELPLYMETQVFTMTSDLILQQAVNEPAVRSTEWAKNYVDAQGVYDATAALIDLREMVNGKVIPDTTFMTLRVTTGSPRQDCAAICNAIAEVYRDDVRKKQQRDTRDIQQRATQNLASSRQELETIDKRIADLLERDKITSLQQKDSLYNEEIRHLQPQIVVLRDEIAKSDQQLELYDGMSKDGLVPETIRSEVERLGIVVQQDSLILQEKAALRALKEKYGDKHRDIKRRKNIIAALELERDALIENQTKELFESTKEALRTTVSRYNASLDELMSRLNDAEQKLQAITVALQQHENLEAERINKLTEIQEFERAITNLAAINDRGSRVRPISIAEIPDQKSFPRLVPMVAISTFLIGGCVGGFIVLREIQETRIRTPQDISAIPRTRVLGVVPDLSMDYANPERIETASYDAPHGVVAESVRQIGTDLLRECKKSGHKSVLVVSGMPGSGASSMVLNIGINAVATDLKVLVLDANFRRPALQSILGLEDGPGLGDMLMRKAELDDVIQKTHIDGLDVICAGSPQHRVYERFTTERMAECSRLVRERYDLILIDVAPAVVSGDALAIASHVDSSILVVRAYSEKRGLIARLRNQLGDAKAEFLGVIVNGVKPSAGGYFKRNFKAAHEYQKSAMPAGGKKSKSNDDNNVGDDS